MSDDGSNSIDSVLTRLEKSKAPNRDLDWDIAEALGGTIRRVSSLGLNGRTPGQWRVFWPGKEGSLRGSAIPFYTKNKDLARQKLILRRAALSSKEA